MFVEVSVVLTWTESSVFLFDKEEGSGLGGVRGADFSSAEVFVKESFGGEAFVGGERVEFSNFGSEGVSEVDFVIIGSRRGNMVCGFFSEY